MGITVPKPFNLTARKKSKESEVKFEKQLKSLKSDFEGSGQKVMAGEDRFLIIHKRIKALKLATPVFN